ncbi:unnamed protein product [Trichogramma brassicae]|uniref:Uncharacterized protein n=1 Tax=Trichogramma brassicae TaxID=86971 RepID=A0A6H5I2G4_9HYME|nr:unnamed protein product [Trichogramma brassicae]
MSDPPGSNDNSNNQRITRAAANLDPSKKEEIEFFAFRTADKTPRTPIRPTAPSASQVSLVDPVILNPDSVISISSSSEIAPSETDNSAETESTGNSNSNGSGNHTPDTEDSEEEQDPIKMPINYNISLDSIDSLLQEHSDRFYLEGDELPATNVVEHKITTVDDIPVNQKQYRLPHSLREEVKRQVEDLYKKAHPRQPGLRNKNLNHQIHLNIQTSTTVKKKSSQVSWNTKLVQVRDKQCPKKRWKNGPNPFRIPGAEPRVNYEQAREDINNNDISGETYDESSEDEGQEGTEEQRPHRYFVLHEGSPRVTFELMGNEVRLVITADRDERCHRESWEPDAPICEVCGKQPDTPGTQVYAAYERGKRESSTHNVNKYILHNFINSHENST